MAKKLRCHCKIGLGQYQITVVIQGPRPWFNIKMSSYQYRKYHCGDKSAIKSSYLHNGISYTGEMASLYWTNPRCPGGSSPTSCWSDRTQRQLFLTSCSMAEYNYLCTLQSFAACMSNYIQRVFWYVITHPYHISNRKKACSPNGWVVTPHCLPWHDISVLCAVNNCRAVRCPKISVIITGKQNRTWPSYQ